MADYTVQIYVDESGAGDGTTFTKAIMDHIEAGIKDAAEHNRIGTFAGMPPASAANKNWLYIVTDATDKAGLYRSDGAAWAKMTVGALANNNTTFGAGGNLNSFSTAYGAVSVNWNSATDRLIDTARPAWRFEFDGRDTFDYFRIARAAPTAGAPTWTLLFSVDNAGMASVPGWTSGKIVTSLPTTGPAGGALVDGQECYYLADATNGVVWHLKYRAAEAGSYKWYCVGGPPLLNVVEAAESKATTAYGDLATVGPTVTTPLAGDYIMEMSAAVASLVAGANRLFISPKKNAVVTNDADGAETSPAGGTVNTDVAYRRKKLTGLAAGDVFKLQYGALNATSHSFGNRALQVMPIRVG